MRVTATENRRKGLTALKLENGSEILLDTEIVIARDIKAGSFIEDLPALKYESDFKRAKSRALWYLSRGDLSEKTLFDKLKSGGFGEEVCFAAVERMKELDLVNDQRYAKRLAEYMSVSGISRKELYFKLIHKGISADIVKDVIETDNGEETEKIKQLLCTKYLKKLETDEGVQKAFAALVRKGFSYRDIKDAFKAYNDEINENGEY